jgi:hypothetical protein
MATVTAQFTLEIPSTHETHARLVKLFKPDLVQQSRPTFKDLSEGDRSAVMAVPFWSWADKQDAVLDILRPYRGDDRFMFIWPLIVDSLPICRVAISPDSVQIAPPCPPVEMIPSFSRAKRRLYMTATLADDSILVTQFDAEPGSVRRPVTPDSADDLGDRMILAPLESFPDANEQTIQNFVAEQSTKRNVVVIVPSWARAEVWKPVAVSVHGAKDLVRFCSACAVAMWV